MPLVVVVRFTAPLLIVRLVLTRPIRHVCEAYSTPSTLGYCVPSDPTGLRLWTCRFPARDLPT